MLTGLRNRRYLARAWAHGLRRLTAPSPWRVDLDHFKQINDRFGTGRDQVSSRSRTARAATRDTDVWCAARREFLIVMPQTDDREAADVCCERMRAAICDATWGEIDPRCAHRASVSPQPANPRP